MYRKALQELQNWKNNPAKKPLVIRGARQVGKTWLMKEFGKTAYTETVYLNFDAEKSAGAIFSGDITPQTIIEGLEIISGKKILPETTLIILDEIQEVPRALSSLKYFAEDAPEYHIICAGSLLGVALHEGTSFPVGKVSFLDLYPLSFAEFIHALGEEGLYHLLKKHSPEALTPFKEKYISLLRLYYFIGGMPEAVLSYAEKRDLGEVRAIQRQILDSYEQDFSKHAPASVVPKIRMLWNSIPSQLAKENKKFIYGVVREGARAKEYEQALLWLIDCGLVCKVPRVTVPKVPLKAYEDLKAFKLYLRDTGLLSCMVSLDAATLLNGNALFAEFKGALTEQYVLTQMQHSAIYYWTNEKGTAEVDFLIELEGGAVPLEVKAETNLQAKSLKVFAEKYSPKVSLRLSMADYQDNGHLINIPLYAAGTIAEYLCKKEN